MPNAKIPRADKSWALYGFQRQRSLTYWRLLIVVPKNLIMYQYGFKHIDPEVPKGVAVPRPDLDRCERHLKGKPVERAGILFKTKTQSLSLDFGPCMGHAIFTEKGKSQGGSKDMEIVFVKTQCAFAEVTDRAADTMPESLDESGNEPVCPAHEYRGLASKAGKFCRPSIRISWAKDPDALDLENRDYG